MKQEDKEWINKRYSDRIKAENFSYEALRSGPWERREIRFDVLCEVGIKTGDSVLDIGCGYGDLSDYFVRKGIDVKYRGIDINPDFISFAKAKYGEEKFELKDILEEDFDNYDWVVSTTCFNLKLKHEDNYIFIERLLQKMHSHANKGVAIDFMSSYVDFKSDIAFHYEPEKMFGIAKSITKRVSLRHDYPIFEFCLYLYPDFNGWSNNK